MKNVFNYPPLFPKSIIETVKILGAFNSLNHLSSLKDSMGSIPESLKGVDFVSKLNLGKSITAFESLGCLSDPVGQIGKLDEYVSALQTQSKLIIETFKKRDEEYESLMDVSQELANNGWLLTYFFGFDDLDSLAKCAKGGRIDNLCEEIKSLYKNKIEEQVDMIINIYPEREFILGPAYRAHARGEYGLSIIGFFTQADGICSNNTGKELFQGWGAKRLSALAITELEKLQEELDFFQIKSDLILRAMMWASVKDKLPISFNSKEREQHRYEGLNRNIFVHGSATEEHATEENSLKAFSILSFVTALLSKEIDE